MLRADRLYETVLYADDLAAAANFYSDVIGLQLLSQNELMLVFAIGENYLLIFKPQLSSIPGRLVPSHGSQGAGHLAFVAEEQELQAWRDKFSQAGIEIEMEVEWDAGRRGRSLYVRDPAGNSVELAPPNLWTYLKNSGGKRD